jgi:hypothetical protein
LPLGAGRRMNKPTNRCEINLRKAAGWGLVVLATLAFWWATGCSRHGGALAAFVWVAFLLA